LSSETLKPLAAIADLQSPLIEGLACSALQPGLRRVLVFDSSPIMLQTAAAQWAEMLAVTIDCPIKPPVYLGPIDTEETLWGNWSLTHTNPTQPFLWNPGLLGGPEESAVRLVVIPDLTRLSLAAVRACIALMGEEIACLERHGQQARWRSQICWMAGCPSDQVKFLSPHLLDRFVLRLTGQDLQVGDRTQALGDWFASLDQPKEGASILSAELRDRLQTVRLIRPAIADSAYQRGLAYFTEAPGPGVRRELALVQLAQAQAQLAGLDQVTATQVDQAARLIGLKAPAIAQSPAAPLVEPSSPPPEPTSPTLPPAIPQNDRPLPPPVASPSEIYRPDSEAEFPPAPMDLRSPTDPYPEDTAPTEREAASLRLPPRRFRTVGRGTIVGIEPATVPQDIAWVSTLLEAAKYQALRRQKAEERLVLRSPDLRRYRRAAVPEQMLMLVLDHTCLKDCQWQATVLPYLQWAYVERSTVCLVQVGAAGQKLQAEKVLAQSVLVPRIRMGLESAAGRATPLAHGLDLALQTLRHALQHGRSTVGRAVLVVISDGRGNVAGQIRSLKQVEAIVLNPQPKHYADLPVKLALALGAKIEAISVVHAWEVDEP
jgi:magnesium chelatase subunit D